MRTFDFSALSVREAYQVMIRAVSPRPIAFVSTLSSDGRANLAPFSYFNIGGANPPSCVICPMNDRTGREKDTLLNIRETGEYVICVVTRAIVEQANAASAAFPRGVSEFDQTGLTPVPSLRVRPPRVAESPIALECRLHTIVTHGEGPLAGNYVIGQILMVHAAEEILDASGLPDPEKIGFVGRMGGNWYAHAAPPAMFELPRPADPGRSL